jgi:hypothetical protein
VGSGWHARVLLSSNAVLFEVGEVGRGNVEGGVGFVDGDCTDHVEEESGVLGVRDARIGKGSEEGLGGSEDEFGMGFVFGGRNEERGDKRFEAGVGAGRDVERKGERCFGTGRDERGCPRVKLLDEC